MLNSREGHLPLPIHSNLWKLLRRRTEYRKKINQQRKDRSSLLVELFRSFKQTEPTNTTNNRSGSGDVNIQRQRELMIWEIERKNMFFLSISHIISSLCLCMLTSPLPLRLFVVFVGSVCLKDLKSSTRSEDLSFRCWLIFLRYSVRRLSNFQRLLCIGRGKCPSLLFSISWLYGGYGLLNSFTIPNASLR